jgi:hypothetical protein
MHPSIRLEGSVLSADILDAIERGEKSHQSAKDFGLDPTAKVKDEIADAWAAARAYWTAYQTRISRLREGATGTTETRNQWLVPFLGLLGYQLTLADSETIQGKTYRISHRDTARDGLPIHLIGCFESLDRRSTVPNAPRMSPHGLVQEYLNLTEHLYGLVSNGRQIRLLRDSSRLVKLTFIEFDLDRIFSEELFADFALLYRLLHASRLPVKQDAVAEAPIEIYHQDSLDSGSRIRDGLSRAVQEVIEKVANGLLSHPANDKLREWVRTSSATANGDPASSFNLHTSSFLYTYLLRLIYRLLFLMVVEERGLALMPGTDKRLRDIYDLGYSLGRLRRLAEKSRFADARHHDAWLALIALFRLVDESGRGLKLGIAPLGGDLFGSGALGPLEECALDNATFLSALRQLTLFTNPVTGQLMRVNYGALNVEEFGSVYQGLLEFEPQVTLIEGKWHFAFAQGDARAATGSHYTPDELVQPLIKHSLDHLIEQRLKDARSKIEATPKHLQTSTFIIHTSEAALLSLRVADISCGSGHILLAAARRIATELAMIRTGDDQPSPAAFREAIRDVIRHCIYGVDLNPLAVELCKVALWLEAHTPGEPLNFLDHHIKCGNAIVGFVTRDELEKGIPDEAFKTLPGDDKEIAAAFRKTNKTERAYHQAGQQSLSPDLRSKCQTLATDLTGIASLPETTPAEITEKKSRYEKLQRAGALLLRQLAAIPIAQFYLPKAAGNKDRLITDASFRHYLSGRHLQGQATAAAWALAQRKKAFHWFLEFPDIIANGGFDCILGNPPYLGGTFLSGTYGHPFCEYVRWQYAPTGLSDLVAYFLRRIFTLLRPNGFTAFITTNSIKDGDIRKDGLEQVIAASGTINMAVRGIKWPGVANLVVSLVSIHRGEWKSECYLDGKPSKTISAYFEDSDDGGDPLVLSENCDSVYQGVDFLGDGFLLTPEKAHSLISANSSNREVVTPALNGQELNSGPSQSPSRWIINFKDWPIEKAKKFDQPFEVVLNLVKPERENQKDEGAKTKWWLFLRPRMEMFQKMHGKQRCFVCAVTTKYLCFVEAASDLVLLKTLKVFTTDRWDHYAVVQSTIHEVWARKYSGALKQDLRYSPSKCFDTFAFPAGQWQTPNPDLAAIGERYHEHRRDLMLRLWLGLTDIYNLFHAPDLEARLAALHAKRAKSGDWRNEILAEHRPLAGSLTPEEARTGIETLRALHVALDQAVLNAYGWQDLPLAHDFQEVETLPENDRTRYTISPTARKTLLTRLLTLNHQRAAEEAALISQNSIGLPQIKKNRAVQQRLKSEGELI